MFATEVLTEVPVQIVNSSPFTHLQTHRAWYLHRIRECDSQAIPQLREVGLVTLYQQPLVILDQDQCLCQTTDNVTPTLFVQTHCDAEGERKERHFTDPCYKTTEANCNRERDSPSPARSPRSAGMKIAFLPAFVTDFWRPKSQASARRLSEAQTLEPVDSASQYSTLSSIRAVSETNSATTTTPSFDTSLRRCLPID